MPLTFLELVNSVSRRVNELELTPTNFASALGHHANAKDAVNAAIRHINQYEFTWPFNWAEHETLMVPGQSRYPYPEDAKFININSFMIHDNDRVYSRRLRPIEYSEYLRRNSRMGGRPHSVYLRPGLEWGVFGTPEQSERVTFDYYKLPMDLENWDDSPTIPSSFKHLIIDGAMWQIYLFRSDHEAAAMEYDKFKEGRSDLKAIFASQEMRATDTRLPGSY